MEIIDKKLKSNGSMGMLNTSKTVYYIQHHSGVLEKQDVEIINDYHIRVKKWTKIGYSYYICKGKIYLGRGLTHDPVHCVGYNNDIALAVCVAGNYNVEHVSDEDYVACNWLYKHVCGKLNKELIIKGHRDFAQTDCPGKNFDLSRIKSQIEIKTPDFRQILSKCLDEPNKFLNAIDEAVRIAGFKSDLGILEQLKYAPEAFIKAFEYGRKFD
jgi:N-acetylmuramoyl-L-alanine amidase